MKDINFNYKTNKSDADITASCFVFAVNGEMKPENGEDSYYYSLDEKKSVVAVLDGCGGIGSRRYNNFSGKTGAYVASRAVCGGVKAWFEETQGDLQKLREYIERALRVCDKFADKEGRLVGSLGKSFPTTLALALADEDTVTCVWAGDSRCYMLDCDGLHQLTEDDVSGEDALSNISNDGVLTNVICSAGEFVLNTITVKINKPCIIFSATDGCFGYLKSPMAFEYLLTSTLMQSENLLQWRKNIKLEIGEVAGDDYTLCALLFGFESFNDLKACLKKRNSTVLNEYIDTEKSVEECWAQYRDDYCGYMQKK